LIAAADLVVSTLAARPRRVSAASRLKDTPPSARLWQDLADAAYKQCRPLTNLDNDTEWRRDMVRILTKKALARAAL